MSQPPHAAAVRYRQLPRSEILGTGLPMDIKYYEIRVCPQPDEAWAEWFNPLTVTNLENGDAMLAGELDQTALQGVLKHILNLGMTLVSVNALSDAEWGEREKDQDDERDHDQ